MATTVYLTNTNSDASTGDQQNKELWTSRGAGVVSISSIAARVGVDPEQIQNGSVSYPDRYSWITPRLNAVTIAGSITTNLRMAEDAMATNNGARVRIYRCSANGTILSTILDSAKGVEFGTAEAAQNWAATPGASVDIAAGERIAVQVWVTQTGGTSTGGVDTLWWAGTSAGASGDSYVTFTETLSQYTGLTIAPSSVTSAEAAGSPTLVQAAGALTVSPSATTSTEVFGTLSLLRGSVAVVVSAIISTEVIGNTGVIWNLFPTGIDTSEVLGSDTLLAGGVSVTAAGIDSSEIHGASLVVPGGLAIRLD